MRVYECDMCGAQKKADIHINRRPIGWATVRVDRVVSESGARRTVLKNQMQYEVCDKCMPGFQRSFRA